MATIRSISEYGQVFDRAEILFDEGKIAEASLSYTSLMQYYVQSQEEGTNMPFTINEFYIVERLADISLLVDNRKATRHLLSALSHQVQIPGNIGIRIHAVTKLVLLDLREGELDTAFATIQSLQDIIGDLRKMDISPAGLPVWENNVQLDPECSEQDERDQFVCLYDVLGAWLLASGRYEESILLFSRGIQIGEQHRSPMVDSRILSMKILLAKAYFQKGDVNIATGILAETGKQAAPARFTSGISLLLLDLRSRIAFARGDFGDAYYLVSEITELCNKYSLPLAAISANINLALIKITLNQTSDAAIILEDCVIRAERIGETALASRIRRFLRIADKQVQSVMPSINYVAQKRRTASPVPQQEETGYELPTYHRSPDYLSFFEDQALLFQLNLADNNIAKASEILSQLRVQFRKCDSVLIHARLGVMEFMQLYYSNTPIPADFKYGQIIHFFTANKLLPELWQFRQLLVRTHLVPEEDKFSWVTSNQQLLDEITSTLPATMQALYLLNKWSANEEYLAGFTDKLFYLKQKTQSGWFGQRWLGRWSLTKELHYFLENTNRYKDYLARQVSAGDKPGGFSFEKPLNGVLNKLWKQPGKSITISILVLPDRVVLITRSFLKMRVYFTYIDRVALRQLVFAVRDWLYPEGKFREIRTRVNTPPSSSLNPEEALKHIGRILQLEQVMKDHGGNIKDIRFVADDVFHGFPFTLLTWNNSTNIPQPCRINVSLDDKIRVRIPAGFANKKILLAGVAEYAPSFNDLPGVLKEMKQVGEQLNAKGAIVSTLLNKEVTLKQTTTLIAGADMVHFAGHGFFDFRKPDQSGLVLSNEEVLTVRTISSLPGMSRIQLLVLSSCRGAEHFILPGRWMIGLPETFCRSGVQSVLAFLWPVEDEFAAAFTSRFYEHLVNNTVAESFYLTLSDAKNRQLPGLSSEYWLPKFWAGAILYER